MHFRDDSPVNADKRHPEQKTIHWRFLPVLIGGLLLAAGLTTLPAQSRTAAQTDDLFVPTLVPPTLVPVAADSLPNPIPDESAVNRIRDEGEVRVGILYNEPPFGELNLRGEVSGFDADIAREMADLWDVDLRFQQVTRQNAVDTLLADQVDMLVAAQVQRRDLDDLVEFSQSYFPGRQSLIVRNEEGEGAVMLTHMQDRKVGVVMGTPGEQAAETWIAQSGMNIEIFRYLTLDQALVALFAREIDGVTANRIRLLRTLVDSEKVRFIDEPVGEEPYAIALRRQDVNLRSLVNRTLQHMVESGRMDEIYAVHFNNARYPVDQFTLWAGVGEDAPRPDNFSTDVPLPGQSVVERIRNGDRIRIAGVGGGDDDDDDDDASASDRINRFNRDFIDALADRWGVEVEYVEGSRDNPLEFVANGDADLAVGVVPHWDWANRVDFTRHYLVRGKRIMVEERSDIYTFVDLRTEWVAVFADEEGAADAVRALADEQRVRIDGFFTIVNEEDAVFGMVAEDNYDAVYGDSIKLRVHLEQNPEDVRLLVGADDEPLWFDPSYVAFAVPRNDLDFRLLVEYSIQELARTGEIYDLLLPVMLPEEMPRYTIQPGQNEQLAPLLGS